jgi:hypothetical protein
MGNNNGGPASINMPTRAQLGDGMRVGKSALRFIGVLRDRLGELEDRFFATGLSRQRALVPRHAVRLSRRGGRNHHHLPARPERLLDSATFTFAVKMAAVFMISTSTLTIRTGFTPRWIALLGLACTLLLLLSGRYY